MKNITIVGGGLVGGLLAVFMAKRGHKVDLYERRSDPRQQRCVRGKVDQPGGEPSGLDRSARGRSGKGRGGDHGSRAMPE